MSTEVLILGLLAGSIGVTAAMIWLLGVGGGGRW